MEIKNNMSRRRLFSAICTVVFCMLFNLGAYPRAATNSTTGLIAFFKGAISSPPDIEKFVAKRTSLLDQINLSNTNLAGTAKLSNASSTRVVYFEGASSGTNFFLYRLPDPAMPAASNIIGTVSARSGSSTYEIGGSGIIYGIGENGLAEDVKSNFLVARQILAMGIGEIAPETVNWSGNKFSARNRLGKEVHGSLQISNDVPFTLEVSLSNDSVPYKVVVYTYATPPGDFAGYPATFLISKRFKDDLKPLAKIEFKSVLLATQQLSASFFDASRFASLVGYTNIFSNSDYYVSQSKTHQLVKLNSYATSGGIANSKSRTVIYILFLFATLPPMVILSIWSVQKIKSK